MLGIMRREANVDQDMRFWPEYPSLLVLPVQTMQASQFKARFLALMDEIAKTGESVLITKHGKPIAELKAHQLPRAAALTDIHKEKIEILGDIVAPALEGAWDALK